ncbi:MAG TPA: hypothetical protein VGL61_10285 [Kofleriaceae bacterium]
MTPAGERARLAVRAKADPAEIPRIRAAGKRALRRGAILLATSPLAAIVLLSLAGRDTVALVLALYFSFAVSVGAGMVLVGWRRLVLASGAHRLLEESRIPIARVRR